MVPVRHPHGVAPFIRREGVTSTRFAEDADDRWRHRAVRLHLPPGSKQEEGTMWQHGHFYWNELMTRDPEGAKTFYGKALGWQFAGMPMPDGTYWVCKDGDSPVGGIFDMNRPEFEGIPPHWFAYIAVDAVDRRVEQAVTTGAQLLRPIFDVPGVGRIAILKDPVGAAVGWITPAQQ
jgi:uncharacterized protein